jgi:peptidoglycan hydrolase-like protein with peptidoglycan-binding domain
MSGTLSPWPVVQNGSQGHPIRTLQFLLRAHGHNLTVDGMFGPATEAAVKALQTSKGMTADGIMSAQTWSTLIIQGEKRQLWRRSSRRPRGVPIPCWRTR